jgi:alpha-beta hydrolase superfamily lysophospholipase
MQTSTPAYTADDGHPLFVHRWAPEAGVPVRGVMHVTHGMAEHSARYARLGEALASRGWVVTAHDQRGHGRSVGPGEELGQFAKTGGWERVVRDVTGLLQWARSEHPGLPLVAFGHSMGSFVTQSALFTRPELADAAVLSGSNGAPGLLAQAGRVVARVERARLGERGRSALLTELSFGAYNKPYQPARTKFDWLSRDAAEVDKYVADPACGFMVTTSMWVDLLDALPTLSKAENLARLPKDLPLYLFSGDKDPVGELGAGVKRLGEAYRQAGLKDVTVRLYPDGRHEMLNELNRQQVMDDLASWLDGHVKVRTRDGRAAA